MTSRRPLTAPISLSLIEPEATGLQPEAELILPNPTGLQPEAVAAS